MADDTNSDPLGHIPGQPEQGTPLGSPAGSEHVPAGSSIDDVLKWLEAPPSDAEHGDPEAVTAGRSAAEDAQPRVADDAWPHVTEQPAPSATSVPPLPAQPEPPATEKAIPYFSAASGFTPPEISAPSSAEPTGAAEQMALGVDDAATSGESAPEPALGPAKKAGLFGFLRRGKKEPAASEVTGAGAAPDPNSPGMVAELAATDVGTPAAGPGPEPEAVPPAPVAPDVAESNAPAKEEAGSKGIPYFATAGAFFARKSRAKSDVPVPPVPPVAGEPEPEVIDAEPAPTGEPELEREPADALASAPEAAAAEPAPAAPETPSDHAAEATAAVAGAAAVTWAAAAAHEPPAVVAPPASAPPVPFIPEEKPGLFGFLKRKKTPEPEIAPWLPPDVASGAGDSVASVWTAADGAATGEAATASGSPADALGSTQPSEPLSTDAPNGASRDSEIAAAGAAAFIASGAGVAETGESDPAASQMTQMLPVVPGPADITSVSQPVLPTAPVQEPLPAIGPMLPTGSRVVVVISRSASPVPMGPGVSVPKTVGQMQGDALGQLQANGLSAQVFNDFSNEPRGEVIAQLPEGGQAAPAGSEVVLLVSSGPAPVTSLLTPLPDVVGMTEADALSKLQLAGLSPQIVRTYSATVPLGVVVEQLPSARSIAAVPHSGRSLWWVWLLLAVAVAAAVGGGVYYYLNRTAVVPQIVGMPQSQAEQALAAAGFKVGSVSTTQTLSASQVGSVTSQTPEPGATQKLTDPIDIVVSGGQLLFAVPNVVGKPVTDAQNEIEAQSLQVSVTQSYSTTTSKDTVMAQSPTAGEKVPTKTTVGVVVSLGVQNVQVPDVNGQATVAAQTALKLANLSSEAFVEHSLTASKGTVFGQFPASGSSVAPGTVIGLLVSNGPPSSSSTSTVSVPTVVGLTESKAKSALSSANLGSAVLEWKGTGQPAGLVVGQLPDAGAYVPQGVKVVLFVSNGK